MNTNRNLLALALFSTLALAACQDKTPTASTAPGAPASTAPAESGGLAGMVGKAMDEARAKMETSNIDISNVAIKFGDSGRKTPAQPKAEITPQGDLLIEGKQVAITPAQRALLLQYRGEVIGVASAGMAIGKQGVDMAGKAISTALANVFNGKSDETEHALEAEGKRIEAAAMKLCDQLQPMLDTQQKLSVEMPAFKPYANLTQADIDDCRKHDKGDTDTDAAARAQTKAEIRDNIRDSIRNAIRQPSSDSNDNAAAEADAAADTAQKGSPAP